MCKLTYRSDIDGLRAIAVLAVVLTHVFETRVPNGFLGVDVFFVISGFVITNSLLQHREQTIPTFLAEFYARRIKRLAPAMLVVVLISTVLICLISPKPEDYLMTAIASTFGGANIQLYFAGLDYFSNAAGLNPFTHMWSLGVEEQFYVFIPLVIWFAMRHEQSRVLSFVLFVVTLVSFVAWGYLQEPSSATAFYLMPFRFWELALGVLACLAVRETLAGRVQRLSERHGIAICGLLFFGRHPHSVAQANPRTWSLAERSRDDHQES